MRQKSHANGPLNLHLLGSVIDLNPDPRKEAGQAPSFLGPESESGAMRRCGWGTAWQRSLDWLGQGTWERAWGPKFGVRSLLPGL